MIYEVWIKKGIDLDYFGSREAAEAYIEKYIRKQNDLAPRFIGPWSREEFEIREKTEPVNNRGVVIPGCEWPRGNDDNS
jgi:hypothetical protein